MIQVGQYDKSTKVKLKLDGDKDVGRKNHNAASKLYSEVSCDMIYNMFVMLF